MKKIVILSFFFFQFQIGFAQDRKSHTKEHSAPVKSALNSVKKDGENVYELNGLETKPEFPGGIQAFYKYVGANFNTPSDKKFKGGRLVVAFVIEKEGNITEVRITNDIGFGTGKEAERVLQNSPAWTPGIQNGKAVRVMYSMPITISPN